MTDTERDDLELVEDEGPIEPDPPFHATHAETERHRFRMEPRNALREKAWDCFGRWYYADTGTTHNLSEAGYAALVAKHGVRG